MSRCPEHSVLYQSPVCLDCRRAVADSRDVDCGRCIHCDSTNLGTTCSACHYAKLVPEPTK